MENKQSTLDKLNKASSENPSNWMEDVAEKQKNARRIEITQLIAVSILSKLRTLKMSQKELAEKLNVSPQTVSTWVKGTENFTIETITKIEEALGYQIIKIDIADSALAEDVLSIIKKQNASAIPIDESIQAKIRQKNLKFLVEQAQELKLGYE